MVATSAAFPVPGLVILSMELLIMAWGAPRAAEGAQSLQGSFPPFWASAELV